MLVIIQVIDLPRFIQVFLVQGLTGLFFLFIGYKTIRRERSGINVILSIFYFVVVIGVIINMIYVYIFNEIVVLFLHFITYYLFCLSLIFLLIFVLILFKTNKITFKKQVTIFIIFSLLLVVLWFIPDGMRLNEVSWIPEWSWPFFIYSIVICSSIAIGPTIYISFKIYRSFQKEILKKKWVFFLIGMCGCFFLYYGTSLSNTLADPTFRLIWSIISLPTLISIYFIYYGVAKSL
ncbi:MAG: hypothetical protein ACTSV5_14905 [Promethearchaeota archaeon]